MSDQEELSLNDEIRAVIAEASTDDDSASAAQPKSQARGEDGKFASKNRESEVDAAARLEPKAKAEGTQEAGAKVKAEAPAAGDAGAEGTEGADGTDAHLLTEDKAPRGWTPAAREKWTSLPEDIRKEILRREESSAVGVRQLQERYAPVENFVRSMEPFINEARSLGVSPDQYIGALASTERLLRTADVPSKFQEILRIADQYGIPLREVINKSVGQEIIKPASAQGGHAGSPIPQEVQRELMEMRQWRQQFEDNNVNAQVAQFSADKEFFEDVRLKMAGFIESGAETSLQAAYDAACWATPAVREVLLARNGQQQQGATLKAKQAVAAGASTRPSGGIDVNIADDDSDDLATTIRKEYARSATGRV